MRRAAVVAVLGALLVALAVAGAHGVTSSAQNAAQNAAQTVAQTAGQGTAQEAGDRPDIVFILMDDFSTELLKTMPNAQRMKRMGASYDNAFAVDSLCCPSRSALLTGQTPQQTGVRANIPVDLNDPIGGYEAFVAHGNGQKQFSVPMQADGYTTGFVGKFINTYEAHVVDGEVVPPPKVPGWTEWRAILGGGYNGWGFNSTWLDTYGNLRLQRHYKPPLTQPEDVRDENYATNVASDEALSFMERHGAEEDPYFLEVAPYAPHERLRPAYPNDPIFPPAFADRADPGDPTGGNCGLSDCADLGLKDLVGYDDPRKDNAPTYLHKNGRTSPAPAWRTNPITLTDEGALNRYRDRARMVQAVDRLVGRVLAEADEDTYVVLTSDNGYHLGQHQLNGGKGAPYDSDTRVPLLVVGPGVSPGPRKQFVSNVDLAATFEELSGTGSGANRSGASFVPSLRDPKARGGRFAFFDHTHATPLSADVDLDGSSFGAVDVIPSYIGVRSAKGLLVRFDLDNSDGVDHAWELYRYDVPWEARNVFAQDHDKPWAKKLMRRLKKYDGCRPAVCRSLTR